MSQSPGASTPDPEPADTPGLEPGGGVAPGDTPPGESSATAGLSAHQPKVGSTGSNWLVYAGVGAVVALCALFFIGYAVGLLD
ncbi:DUF6480 family protein [Cellulomonas shaoxiangyii]|uniref:Uncharacterized protein n=2 Tax=Cellulomonas shaoxiangyii TaxID=2566013 RepID=A0A4P7SLT7_9CELL|nr:DUF6480 family protein [Cellulomonas shaoxiangyii]QCB94156.1 hypothetical protein E5225_11885 [Cellulomonas shaoxiangyii]TGY86649.1 hypothetical protein E5226_00845 [Cellulomonas shaoxiangyii]